MSEKTTKREQPSPEERTTLRTLLSGALPGILHQADHWYVLCFSPRQASLQPEQMYAPLDQLYRQAVREVQHALAAFRNPWIPAPRCLCVSMQRDILYHGNWHQVWCGFQISFARF